MAQGRHPCESWSFKEYGEEVGGECSWSWGLHFPANELIMFAVDKCCIIQIKPNVEPQMLKETHVVMGEKPFTTIMPPIICQTPIMRFTWTPVSGALFNKAKDRSINQIYWAKWEFLWDLLSSETGCKRQANCHHITRTHLRYCQSQLTDF